jgi:Ca2+-binding EF-hand superfamily protein
VLLNLTACTRPCKLLFEMLVLFCQFIDDKDIIAIKQTFNTMDDDLSGVIEVEELRNAFLQRTKKS